MDLEQLKKLFEEQMELTKKLHGKIDTLESSGKNVQRESTESVEKIQKRLDEIEVQMKRLQTPAPPAEDPERKSKEADALYLKAFTTMMRSEDWKQHLSADELKALTSDVDSQGGYLLPRNVSNQIVKKLIEFSPIRELAGVITISKGDMYEEPVEGSTDFLGGWVGERGARPETQSAKLNMEKIPVHEMYAHPYVTQKLLDDEAFGVESWLSDRLGTRFMVMEGAAFISGDANGKPEGVLTKTGITEVNSGDANLLKADGIMDLFYTLPDYYAKLATFVMKRATVGAIRKLKDSAGNYLWAPGLAGASIGGNLAAAQPATILDRPYREAIDMPAVAAGNYPIVFGAWNLGYRIVDRQDIRVLRDPYSNKPYITFYTTRRVGGQVILAEAFVKQKVSA